MQISRLAAGVFILFFGLSVASPVVAKESGALTPEQRQEIKNLVQQYLLDNPKVILESVQRLQDQEQAAKRAHTKNALTLSHQKLNNDPDSPVAGNPKGDVTVVEFFDYRCGYCKKVHPSIMKSIETDKNVRYVFKEFPILGPESVVASKAALAVSRVSPTKYYAYHNIVMGARGSLTKTALLKMAADVGVNPDTVEKEMASPEIENIIKKNYALAQSLNISGTPAFVIGDQLVPGAMDYGTLERMIAEIRAKG